MAEPCLTCLYPKMHFPLSLSFIFITIWLLLVTVYVIGGLLVLYAHLPNDTSQLNGDTLLKHLN